MNDLVYRDGLYYKKFTDVPVTGTTTREEQGSFNNGKKDDPWISYHKNGQLDSKGTRKNGKKVGPWVRYHDNGQLWFKGTYKDGKRDGYFESYNEDGTVIPNLTGAYTNSRRVK
jgi:antitoxin component YwqK of YwqJK toxin-antitoxin module